MVLIISFLHQKIPPIFSCVTSKAVKIIKLIMDLNWQAVEKECCNFAIKKCLQASRILNCMLGIATL